MRLTRTRRYMLLRNAVKQLAPGRFGEHGPVTDDPDRDGAEQVLLAWPSGLPKPRVGLVRDVDDYPYWTKYRRFLLANDIPFELFDIHCSSWLSDAQRFDMVVWRPMSFPYELDECRRKFHILEHRLGMLCCPSFAEAQLYEDKITQYELMKHHGLPVIDTLVSHSEDEVMGHLASCDYPLVWKLTAGSGSLGVELVHRRRKAERWARRVFDFAGRRTYWPYVGQKNYVYLQRFVPHARHDIRVIVIGGVVFGYHRDVPKGEFRASGMELLRRDPPPSEALCLARHVAQVLDLAHVAVDMLVDSEEKDLRIIELSGFTRAKTPVWMCVDGVPGVFVFDGPGDEHRFVPMRVWPQELALRRVLETRWIAPRMRDGSGRG